SGIGLSDLDRQYSDGAVARYSINSSYVHSPLAVTVSTLVSRREGDGRTHWINYYGPPGTFKAISYRDVLVPATDLRSMAAGKVVFIGQTPFATNQQSTLDQHKTLFTGFSKEMSSGVEIHATVFCNLTNDQWLDELPNLIEWMIVVFAGVLAGSYFP